MRLDHALTFVRHLTRYRYRNCVARHPRGAFLRHPYLREASNAEFEQAIDAEKNPCGKLVWVEIDKLVKGQGCLGFRRLLKQLRRYPLKKLPIVVRLRSGRFYLWDGNHRVVAHIMLGKRRVKCLMVGRSK